MNSTGQACRPLQVFHRTLEVNSCALWETNGYFHKNAMTTCECCQVFEATCISSPWPWIKAVSYQEVQLQLIWQSFLPLLSSNSNLWTISCYFLQLFSINSVVSRYCQNNKPLHLLFYNGNDWCILYPKYLSVWILESYKSLTLFLQLFQTLGPIVVVILLLCFYSSRNNTVERTNKNISDITGV